MATPAPPGDASAALDNFKPPAGVVLPPREVRNILEKTAGYVARNGAVFEERIREKESQNPKFSFLGPSDAYYPFYQWRLGEIKAGRGTDIAAGRVGEAAQNDKPKGPPPPPEFSFSAKMPRINQKDLEVLKLTALYTAKHGRQWMTQLAQREAGNPQFQFLIPNHTFHNFFQHMVSQYAKVIKYFEDPRQRTAVLAMTEETTASRLERCRQRAEYAKFQGAEKKKKEEEEVQKAQDFARIDWGEFVVVETISFTDADENANLPPPTSLSELQYASLEDRNKASISANLRIEEAMPGEEFSIMQNGYGAAAPPPSYTLPPHPGPSQANQPGPQAYQPGPVPPHFPGQQPARPVQADDEEARRIQERADAQARMQQAQAEARGGVAPMKIRENYVPRAAQRAANKQGTQTALCPNCKQQIPMNELDEHMRSETRRIPPSPKRQRQY